MVGVVVVVRIVAVVAVVVIVPDVRHGQQTAGRKQKTEGKKAKASEKEATKNGQTDMPKTRRVQQALRHRKKLCLSRQKRWPWCGMERIVAGKGNGAFVLCRQRRMERQRKQGIHSGMSWEDTAVCFASPSSCRSLVVTTGTVGLCFCTITDLGSCVVLCRLFQKLLKAEAEAEREGNGARPQFSYQPSVFVLETYQSGRRGRKPKRRQGRQGGQQRTSSSWIQKRKGREV